MNSPTLSQTLQQPRESILSKIFQNQGLIIWVCVIVLCIIVSFVSPAFLTSRNLLNVLRQATPLGILAIGQTIVLLCAGCDLSQGTTMTLAAVVAFAALHSKNELILPVILFSLAIGGAVGLFNGFIITRFQVPPFMLTLGTREIVFGIGLVFTSGTPKDFITPLFRQVLGRTDLLGIPGQVVIWAGIILIGWFLLSKTVFGQQLYATGGNKRCARQSGIHTDRVIILTYVISGITAALAGLVLAARAGHAGNTMGNGYELNSIAACVIGGTLFSGGRGGLFGTIGGVLLMTVLQNILNILGVNPSVYFVVMGLVIAIAMALGKGGEN